MPDGEEKSFPATPKRRLEARKQGNVARSPEFSAASTLLAMVVALHAALPSVAGAALLEEARSAFHFRPADLDFDLGSARAWQIHSLYGMGSILLPAMLLAMVLGVAVNIGQVGFNVTPEALMPKWDRINPASGFKRLFSMRGSVELLKGIVKMGIIGGICYLVVHHAIVSDGLFYIEGSTLRVTLAVVGSILWTLGLRVSIALFILAVADYAFQRYDYEKNIRMSASEVKQEMKDTDGDPQTKMRMRRIQREMAKRRMMQAVPKADVVVTNPTHYAVALLYETGATAPKLVAKGQDFIAEQIKELARKHHVPVVENVALAQALYKTVEIGAEIPSDVYEAVAQVLAFVYRTYGRRRVPTPNRRRRVLPRQD